MKAWMVRGKYKFSASVVFAETRGKARALAKRTYCCEDVRFTDIEVTRMKPADKYYKDGKWKLDWENPQDRIILVKECDFVCDWDYFDLDDCGMCSAKEYCDSYKDRIQEKECLFCVNSMSADAPDGTQVLVCFDCKGYEGTEMRVDEVCENYKEK